MLYLYKRVKGARGGKSAKREWKILIMRKCFWIGKGI